MSGLSPKQQIWLEAYTQTWNATEAARVAKYAFPNVEGPKNLVNPSLAALIAAKIAEIMPAGEVITILAEQARGSLDDVISFHTKYEPTTVKKPLREIIEDLGATIKFEEVVVERMKLTDTDMMDHQKQMASMRKRIIRMEVQLERDPDAVGDAPGEPIAVQIPYIDLEKLKRLGKMHLVRSYNAKDGKVEFYDAHAAAVDLGKHHGLFKDVLEMNFNPDDYTLDQLRRIAAGESPAKVLLGG